MKKNIHILLLIICLCFSYLTEAQENELNKAVIVNKQIHWIRLVPANVNFINHTFKTPTPYLRSFNLEKKHLPIFTDMFIEGESKRYAFPLCWDILEDNLYPIAFSEGNNKSSPGFSVFKIPLEKEDTIKVIERERKLQEELKAQFPDEKERENQYYSILINRSYLRNSRNLTIISQLIERLEKNYYLVRKRIAPQAVCYDFFLTDTERMEFLIRDTAQVTHWSYYYPPTPKGKSSWEEIKTYSSVAKGEYSITDTMLLKRGERKEFGNPYLPSGKKTVYESVGDSLFFTGHFKFIAQGENRFIINQHHGAIYYLGENAIEKVGQIDLANYTRTLKGQKLFIEDRDAGELIFFAEVEQFNSNLPFPKTRIILDDKTFRKMFKNVIEE